VTDATSPTAGPQRCHGSLANKLTIDNYPKWLKFRDLMKTEMGIRAEAPTQTAMTALWRKTRCSWAWWAANAGNAARPSSQDGYLRQPGLRRLHSQDDYEFADQPAKVKTFTGDMLAVSVDPPAIYGMVQFDDGGRMMADFTDCAWTTSRSGLPVQMAFRKRNRGQGARVRQLLLESGSRSRAPSKR
jgi:hypothetical protein